MKQDKRFVISDAETQIYNYIKRFKNKKKTK